MNLYSETGIGHTTDELLFLRRCAEACGDWAEARRITEILARRRHSKGKRVKRA